MAVTRLLLHVALVCSLVAYGSQLNAEPGKGRGHGKDKREHSYEKSEGHGKGREKSNHKEKERSYYFNDQDRLTIRGLLAERYAPNCPPGLAKKRNGCLPPGIAKKRYNVGYPLAEGIEFEWLPDSWLSRLGPVPSGYRYVMVDKDVLLISEATHKVVDAITLLSAVGK